MRPLRETFVAGFLVALFPFGLLAQSLQSVSVPRVIRVSGVFTPADGVPAGPVEVVTLSIYAEPEGGTPLWQETQTVALDEHGRYSLLLGAMRSEGIPPSVFASGDAQWLGTLFSRTGEVEGPRARIASVPYALRASDAETLGGRPASDYLLAPAGTKTTEGTATEAGPETGVVAQAVLPGSTNFLAKYVNGADIGNSAVYETNGFLGLGTTAPLDLFHVRFTNTTGSATGLAVQNLGNTANSYSGMLFYDQNGALGQFQGFNNATHEYRINNIASGGSINFMTDGTSRFLVTNSGNIGVGTSSPAGAFEVRRSGTPSTILATGFHSFPTAVGGSFIGTRGRGTAAAPTGVLSGDILVSLIGAGHDGNGFANGAFVTVRATEDWTDSAHGTRIQFSTAGTGTGGTAIRMTIDADGNVGIGTSNSVDKLQVLGDIRVGTTGTNGCLKNFAGTGLIGICSSDRRLKKDITPFAPALAQVAALRPVHYHWRASEFPARHYGEAPAYGLVAQDVEQVLPELVVTDADGFKAVDYSKLPLLAVQAIKELKAENDGLKRDMEVLVRRLGELEQQFKEQYATTARR